MFLKSESHVRIRFKNICVNKNFLIYLVYSQKWMENPPNLLIITIILLLATQDYLDHVKQYSIYND